MAKLTITTGKRPKQSVSMEQHNRIVERVVYQDREVVVEKSIEVPVVTEVEKVVYIDRPVETITERIVTVEVPVIKEVVVEKIVNVDKVVEKPVYIDRIHAVDKVVTHVVTNKRHVLYAAIVAFICGAVVGRL